MHVSSGQPPCQRPNAAFAYAVKHTANAPFAVRRVWGVGSTDFRLLVIASMRRMQLILPGAFVAALESRALSAKVKGQSCRSTCRIAVSLWTKHCPILGLGQRAFARKAAHTRPKARDNALFVPAAEDVYRHPPPVHALTG